MQKAREQLQFCEMAKSVERVWWFLFNMVVGRRSLMLLYCVVLMYCIVFCVLLGGCTKIFDAAAYCASDIISRNAAKRLQSRNIITPDKKLPLKNWTR